MSHDIKTCKKSKPTQRRRQTQLRTPPKFFSSQVSEARRFYLNLAPPASKPVAVVCGGCEHCTPDYAIHRTTFPYFVIEFVIRGHGSLTLGGQHFTLHSGSLFTFGPRIPHDVTTDPSDPIVEYFVVFSGTRTLRMLEQGSLAPGSFRTVFAIGEIQQIFDDLCSNGLKETRYSSQICEALLEYLILKISDSLMHNEASKTPAFATYQRCRNYIQSHFLQLHTQSQIAKECHIDPAYLCRLFRRYDHQTCYQFLMRLKMNMATERLQDPGTLVKQVAAELGFCDSFQFSKMFKSIFGLSPEEFRHFR
jgi:AraC-like DNA-binding protein